MIKLLNLYSIKMFFQIIVFKCFLKVSNDLELLMLAGRLFHSLGAATEYDVPAERSPLYRSTISLSGASNDWDRVRLVMFCFTSRSERYPGVPVRMALNVTINSLYFILDATRNQ